MTAEEKEGAKIVAKTLSTGKFLGFTFLQTITFVVMGVWLFRGYTAQVESVAKEQVLITTHVEDLAEKVIRIDTDGSKVWQSRRPDDNRTLDKLETRLNSLERAVNDQNMTLARLVVLAEQSQRILKEQSK